MFIWASHHISMVCLFVSLLSLGFQAAEMYSNQPSFEVRIEMNLCSPENDRVRMVIGNGINTDNTQVWVLDGM